VKQYSIFVEMSIVILRLLIVMGLIDWFESVVICRRIGPGEKHIVLQASQGLAIKSFKVFCGPLNLLLFWGGN
jgi:hypothetical protein